MAIPFPAGRIAHALLAAALLSGCAPSEEEWARLEKLAAVRRVALVTFAARADAGPELNRALLEATYRSFQAMADSGPETLELIPVREVVDNPAYRQLTPVRMPEGALSAVEGLTYLKQGIEAGRPFDAGPLISALGVDAVLLVFVHYGAEVENNGSAPYLTAKVTAGLVAPPSETLWTLGVMGDQREMIPVSVVTHPELMGEIGTRWVLMSGPTPEHVAQLMTIALQKETKLPARMGEQTFGGLARAVRKARDRVEARAARRTG
jgi:hypothetical protein